MTTNWRGAYIAESFGEKVGMTYIDASLVPHARQATALACLMALPLTHSQPTPRRHVSIKVLMPAAALLAPAALLLIDMRAALVGAVGILLWIFARIVLNALR